jgi:hypothetical protein
MPTGMVRSSNLPYPCMKSTLTLAVPKDNMPELKTIVTQEYHKYLKIFKKVNADKLYPHHPCNHKIPLVDDSQPPFSLVYPVSLPELEKLKLWLDKNLAKVFICATSCPVAGPILFVKKGHGSLWLVINYHGINEGTCELWAYQLADSRVTG